jgi:hypothetical protein
MMKVITAPITSANIERINILSNSIELRNVLCESQPLYISQLANMIDTNVNSIVIIYILFKCHRVSPNRHQAHP